MSLKWKIYFWIIACQIVLFPGSVMFTGRASLTEMIDYTFLIISIVGLYGYVFEKDLGHPNFWKVFFPLLLIWDLYSEFWPSISLGMLSGPIIMMSVSVLVIFVPLYLAIYRYAFRRPKETPEGI